MIFKRLKEEIDSILIRDPAARSRLEVALCYPGFHALLFHRLAHWAWQRRWRLAGRFLSYLSRMLTGIEIHPGARIGRRLFIDHGMGVVIGETATLGDDITLYQGVTLGGTSLHKDKRHPTLGNGVIVGAGAQVLGPFTVGDGARIGANAVVVKKVAPGVTVTGIPARPVDESPALPGNAIETFCSYGLANADLPDPLLRALNGLRDEVVSLRARLTELEERSAGAMFASSPPSAGWGDSRTPPPLL